MSPKLYHGAIITCVDGLWANKVREAAIEVLGGDITDLFTRPGGVKQIHPDCAISHNQVRELIMVSIGLHGINQIMLCNHWNCGAYGGSKAFNNPTEERDAHLQHLWAGAEFLRSTMETYLHEILRKPDDFLGLNIGHIRRSVNYGIKIHPVLIIPNDLDQPFSGDPDDCTPLIL